MQVRSFEIKYDKESIVVNVAKYNLDRKLLNSSYIYFIYLMMHTDTTFLKFSNPLFCLVRMSQDKRTMSTRSQRKEAEQQSPLKLITIASKYCNPKVFHTQETEISHLLTYAINPISLCKPASQLSNLPTCTCT